MQDKLSPQDLDLLGRAPSSNAERAETARSFLEAFCDPRAYPIHGRRLQSYGCTIAGTSNTRILIGAHYDKASKGQGIADNWTGVILVRRLLDYYTRHPHEQTLEFVMFGEEEPGMLGSSSFLRQRSAREFAAMINIDTLGVGTLTIDSRSDNRLECLADQLADSLGVESRSLNLHISTGDWEPFQRRGVPVLNLHSLDRKSYRIVHTSRDNLDAVDTGRLDDAYRLILNIVENVGLLVE